jgi:hypothetical protein
LLLLLLSSLTPLSKKAEWNVTIKRETKYSEKYSKDGFSCLMEADKNIFVSGYIKLFK